MVERFVRIEEVVVSITSFVRIEEVVVSITISSTRTLRIPPRRVFFFLKTVGIPPFCGNWPLCTEVRQSAPRYTV